MPPTNRYLRKRRIGTPVTWVLAGIMCEEPAIVAPGDGFQTTAWYPCNPLVVLASDVDSRYERAALQSRTSKAPDRVTGPSV